MTTLVHEYNPNSRKEQVTVGDNLIFPGIQSCVAVFAEHDGELVGIHLTISNKNNISTYDDVVAKFRAKCGGNQPSPIYAIGAITSQWHQLLKRFEASVKYFPTQTGKVFQKKGEVDPKFLIDLQVKIESGNIKFGMQPMSKNSYKPDNAFQKFDDANLLHPL